MWQGRVISEMMRRCVASYPRGGRLYRIKEIRGMDSLREHASIGFIWGTELMQIVRRQWCSIHHELLA